MLINILNYVLMFFVFSAIGWTIETIYCSLGNKKFINRGFLYGPVCPIYGAGALIFEVLVAPLGDPLAKRWWLVVITGMVLADILEYLTSYIMEKLFNARWWDYSENFLNLHGRICFKHTCYWGLFSFLFVYAVSPVYNYFIGYVPQNTRNIAVGVILVIFLIDLILTVRATMDIHRLMKKIEAFRASLSEYGEILKLAAESIKDATEITYADKKTELINQFKDIRSSIDALNEKSSRLYSGATKRLYSSFANLKSITEKRLREIEGLAEEIKSRFTD